MRDEHLLLLRINFGAELILRVLFNGGQRPLLDADRGRSGVLDFHLLLSAALVRDRIGLLRFTRSGAFARMQNVPFEGLRRIPRFPEDVDHIGLPLRERSRLDERNSEFRYQIAQTAFSRRCAILSSQQSSRAPLGARERTGSAQFEAELGRPARQMKIRQASFVP